MLRRLGVSKSLSIAFDALVIVAIIFFSVGLGEVVSWFDRSTPIKVHGYVFRDLSVAPRQSLIYEVFFTRQRFCETHVERWFVGSDGGVRPIEPRESGMPTEGLNVRQRSIPPVNIRVRADLPPGRAKFCFQPTWRCDRFSRFFPIEGPERCFDFIVDAAPAMSFAPRFFSPLASLEGGG